MSNLSEWIKTCDDLEARCNELKAENARLKAEVERLKTEVEHLMVFCNCTLIPNKELQAEVERLRKAGDAMASEIIGCYKAEGYDPADSQTLPKWNAAKEGKPSV